jgi:predicted phage tail component-like protein
MNTFTYNGVTSSAYGIFIEHRPVVAFPKRRIESITIPGRSGNLLFDTGAYDNVAVTYQAAYRGNVRDTGRDIASWLYQNDYLTLTDSYDPSYFRKAVYVSPLNITDIIAVAGRAAITFDCKPQRYLLSGLTAITPTSGDDITNLYQPSLPIISFTGNGVLTVGSRTVTIAGNTGTLILDSENQTASVGGNNANNLITLSDGFPVLENGDTIVSWTGISNVSIIPNWWTL